MANRRQTVYFNPEFQRGNLLGEHLYYYQTMQRNQQTIIMQQNENTILRSTIEVYESLSIHNEKIYANNIQKMNKQSLENDIKLLEGR